MKKNSFELRVCDEQWSSFLSSSLLHSIHVIIEKWQLTHNKLEDIRSGLVTTTNYDCDESSLLSRLVAAIVSKCHDLCWHCVDVSYSWKLLIHGDLDLTFVNLDSCTRNLSKIYKMELLTKRLSRLLCQSQVLALRKEDMRFYMRDLTTRMKTVDLGMK